MRRNLVVSFAFFFCLLISRREASSTSDRDNLFRENDFVSSSESNELLHPVIPTTDYTYLTRSCLYVSPDLPPCRFYRNDNYQRFHRSLEELNKGGKPTKTFPFEEWKGYLPSRLPFKMTLCESKESFERAAKILKLYSFQAIEEERRNT